MITSTLTVKENIAFSAFIRMSANSTVEEREERIRDVLEKMNLEECADTRVSYAFAIKYIASKHNVINIYTATILHGFLYYMVML